LKSELYEVWGDTVDGRHLMYSITIGAVVSLGVFYAAQFLFVGWVANEQMARAYAMLVGIVGCLVGGAISARLFKPKRHVVEHQADPAWRAQVLIELQSEFGDLGKMSDLPPETIAELKEMDLFDLFDDREKAAATPAKTADKQVLEPVMPVRANGGHS
jgi:hypothetical protein